MESAVNKPDHRLLRRRAKLIVAGLAVLLVPLLVLLAELGARMFLPWLDPLAVFVASPQLREDTQGASTNGLFEFDPELTWRLKPGLRGLWWDYTPVSTNHSHFRMGREVGAPGSLRIVCAGDSVTFGYRVPVAHDREKPGVFDAGEVPYPARLETALRVSHPDAEVVPLACPGYTSGQGLAWLRREIGRLKPRIVTACFGWNDVRAAGLPDRLTQPKPGTQVFARRMIASSQLLLHTAQAAQARRAPLVPPAPEPRSSVEEYVANFAAMQALCQEHGASFHIILPVYRDANTPGTYPESPQHPGDVEEGRRMRDYREQLRAFAQSQSIPMIELPELTEAGWPGNARYFGERIHPNADGHALLAKRLLEHLQNTDLRR